VTQFHSAVAADFAKDYENLARSHVSFVIFAMIRLMLRRIVRLAGAA
jgi:hypothetical protein